MLFKPKCKTCFTPNTLPVPMCLYHDNINLKPEPNFPKLHFQDVSLAFRVEGECTNYTRSVN